MAESILLLIILLIIIAISIGIYLYTQQNTTDDKSFSDRELNLIDKAIENTKPIITTNIDTKLDDGNYVKTDDLKTDRSNIQSNQDKITEITDLRTTGDKDYTVPAAGEADGAGNGDISVGQYQYIMQDITDNSDAKIELKNKVNIANDFNICNETQSVCYKFTVDGANNLNIVKTDGNNEINDGKIFFKNALELYDENAEEINNKYFKGPNTQPILLASPSILNDQDFNIQQNVFNDEALRPQFIISNYVEVNDEGSSKTKNQLDTEHKYYIKWFNDESGSSTFEFITMFPFSKLLEPILEYYDLSISSSIRLKMNYTGNILERYTISGPQYPQPINTTPISTILYYRNPENGTALANPLKVTIKYIQKSSEKPIPIE